MRHLLQFQRFPQLAQIGQPAGHRAQVGAKELSQHRHGHPLMLGDVLARVLRGIGGQGPLGDTGGRAGQGQRRSGVRGAAVLAFMRSPR